MPLKVIEQDKSPCLELRVPRRIKRLAGWQAVGGRAERLRWRP
jgi:hypothetical protein